MHGKYFFLAFAIIMVLASPVAGSLTKITAGAPVYIGEQNLNIAAGLQGCRVIEWYEPGADTSAPPQKNVTIIKTLEDSDIAFSYTIKPEIYSGYEGNWYCGGQKPLRPVFEVRKPRISVRFWDLDSDSDVTGQTIPLTANITYRVDTNLDTALQLKYRPEMTLLDSFYTITLTDPGNKALNTIYTGSYGKADSHGLIFEKKPFISVSPYIWKDGSAWDRTSRNIQGDAIYPPGTYSISVSQNLNRMDALYTDLYPDERVGLLESTASVTFIKPESTFVQTTTSPVITPAVEVTTMQTDVTPASTRTDTTPSVTRMTTIPTKTTYAPQSLWIVLAALGLAVVYAARQKK
ncbi:MAG: DUF3821 domain-containing protein [Methanoregula sp.]|jgi:hypothetical protein